MSLTAFASERWVVDPADAKCLMEHIEDYRKSDDDPVYIFLRACPTVDRREALSKLQRNSGTGIRTRAQEGLDEVIFYTPADLNCLLERGATIAGDPVELPKEPCN
jgi:hypothetical protein